MRAQCANFQRLKRQLQIVDRRGWRGKVKNRIERPLDKHIVGDIMLDIAEAIVARQVRDVVGMAGDQVVHRDDRMALGQEAVAQVGAEKASAAGDQDTHWSKFSSIASGSPHRLWWVGWLGGGSPLQTSPVNITVVEH